MNDRKLERSYGRGFGQQQFFANSIENFILHENKTWKWLVAAWNLQIIKTFLTLELSQYSKRNSTFSSRAWESVPASSNCSLQPTRKHPHCHPVFVHASLTSPSCAGALPQELGIWFCSQNLRLSSGIAFGSNCQMIGRGLNLDSNLNSAPDQLVVKVLSALMCLNNLCGVWILFTGLLKMPKLRTVVSLYQPSSTRLSRLSSSSS